MNTSPKSVITFDSILGMPFPSAPVTFPSNPGFNSISFLLTASICCSAGRAWWLSPTLEGGRVPGCVRLSRRLPWPDRPTRSCNWAGLFAGRRRRRGDFGVFDIPGFSDSCNLAAGTSRKPECCCNSGFPGAFHAKVTGQLLWHPLIVRPANLNPRRGDRSETCSAAAIKVPKRHPCEWRQVGYTTCCYSSTKSEASHSAVRGRIICPCHGSSPHN